eukprot:symbB.v1.2.010318.t1/scaffold673.1/size173606/13
MAAEPEEEEETTQVEETEETPEELPRVPCHIFLPVVPAARVIGKGGASIKAIREQSGANLRVLQKELPHEMQRREDRVAVITGEAQQVQEAIAGVLERVFDRSGLPETAEGSLRDRDYIVEVLVPEKSGSHLIGQKGERVKTLCQETKCDIRVGQDRVSGLAEHKKVRISGSSATDAAGAIWRLMEVLGELVAGGVLKSEHFDLRDGAAASMFNPPQRRDQKEVAVRLLIAKEDAAWILGKRGNKIARLRDWAKVNMIDADAPPFDAAERVLEISTASLESRVKVVQMVLEDLASRHEAHEKLRMLVPTELFGSVMGHRGETLRNIIQSSRAQVGKTDSLKTTPMACAACHQIVAPSPCGRDVPLKHNKMRQPLPFDDVESSHPSPPPAWDPMSRSTDDVIEDLLLTLANAGLTPFAVHCVQTLDGPLRLSNALRLVFGLAVSVRQESQLTDEQWERLTPWLQPLSESKSGSQWNHGKNVYVKTSVQCREDPAQLLYADSLLDMDRWVERNFNASCHGFLARGKTEAFSEDCRSFTKRQKGRRLSLVSENQVHHRGTVRDYREVPTFRRSSLCS